MASITFLDFFTHPLFRAPTFASLFMCVASALLGVVVFLQKKSLISEVISHAAYPGAIFSIFLFSLYDKNFFFPLLIGSLFSSFLGLKLLSWLEKKRNVSPDAALLFVLSLFFGIGIVLVSVVQTEYPKAYQKVQTLLFGQAATMSDVHILLYGTLTLGIALFVALFFRPLSLFLFDRSYAKTIGLNVSLLEKVFLALLLVALVVGIRSVGVILLAGMVISPAVAARAYTDRLKTLFWLAALFGSLSALLGNLTSVWLSEWRSVSLPTGPMIVLFGGFFAFFSLLFSPKRGLFFRWIRSMRFRRLCVEENLLKGLWKKESRWMGQIQSSSSVWMRRRLLSKGLIQREGDFFSLTSEGEKRAKLIVRRHRLWELYLREKVGIGLDRVHESAEEMEHILNSDFEERLTTLLSNPKKDPHDQPIPERVP